MLKKSTTKKMKTLIYPVAFVLIVILSAVYKLVFKGNAMPVVEAFKNSKSYQLSEETEGASSSSESEIASATDDTSQNRAETVQTISVYICGEVINPGIYEAPKGAMLNEIIEDAGGLTDDASADNINFVYRIECNMSIYIPSGDEIAGVFTGGDIIRQDGVYVWGVSSDQNTSAGEETALMVNINTATEDDLKQLPGIGDVTAQAIVEYRKDKPFKSTEEIKNVTGIGDSKYNRIKDHICV